MAGSHKAVRRGRVFSWLWDSCRLNPITMARGSPEIVNTDQGSRFSGAESSPRFSAAAHVSAWTAKGGYLTRQACTEAIG